MTLGKSVPSAVACHVSRGVKNFPVPGWYEDQRPRWVLTCRSFCYPREGPRQPGSAGAQGSGSREGG